MSMRALSSYAVSRFRTLKAKWYAARAKRRANRVKESTPV